MKRLEGFSLFNPFLVQKSPFLACGFGWPGQRRGTVTVDMIHKVHLLECCRELILVKDN